MSADLDYLTQDGLSRFDLANMSKIIREGHGTWNHAELMRALQLYLTAASANRGRKVFVRLIPVTA